jgi:predicted PurR-regulated permease PerM
MISSRLPQLRQKLRNHLPPVWFSKYLPMLQRIKQTVLLWLKAQCKLTGLTYLLLLAGFLLLGIPYGFLWAVPVALVDAMPVLGTGMVLLPWALVCFLQEKTFQAVGFVALWVAAVVLRRVVEPKMLGKQLGLDPLLTLVFLYAGYRFWGVWGMVLAPLLAAAAKGIAG